jgi:hypothetical protein
MNECEWSVGGMILTGKTEGLDRSVGGMILTGKSDVLYRNLSQCQFVYNKTHID